MDRHVQRRKYTSWHRWRGSTTWQPQRRSAFRGLVSVLALLPINYSCSINSSLLLHRLHATVRVEGAQTALLKFLFVPTGGGRELSWNAQVTKNGCGCSRKLSSSQAFLEENIELSASSGTSFSLKCQQFLLLHVFNQFKCSYITNAFNRGFSKGWRELFDGIIRKLWSRTEQWEVSTGLRLSQFDCTR